MTLMSMPHLAAVSLMSTPASMAPAKAASATERSTFSVSWPAFFRWNLALSGSYLYLGSGSIEYLTALAIGLSLPTVAWSRKTFFWISSRSIAHLIAVRTSLLSKGAIVVFMGST